MSGRRISPLTPLPAWQQQLIDATSPRDVGEVILRLAQAVPACVQASLLWGDGETQPDGSQVMPADAVWAQSVLAHKRYGLSDDGKQMAWRLLPDQTVVLLLHFAYGQRERRLRVILAAQFALASHHLKLALALADLNASHLKLERSEQLQRALFSIADLTGSDLAMPEILRGIHDVVSTLMYAENFFIVRYNAQSETLRFLYFADVIDRDGQDTTREMPMAHWRGTLTHLVLTSGYPQRGSVWELRRKISGRVLKIGPDSHDWLGVPIVLRGEVLGALVVQSYREDRGFAAEDRELLGFVGTHIFVALERKQSKDDLEWHVRLRTQELAQANGNLKQEIRERQRAEQLQATLFQLARLATAEIDQRAFYTRVHAVVGQLLDAENFYIALVDEAGASMTFPYAVDATGDEPYRDRPLAQGLSEYVMAHGPLRMNRESTLDMVQRGLIDLPTVGTVAMHWLGVPLVVDDDVIGVVVLQTYKTDVVYSEADRDLLQFAALQIASSIHRRRSAAALQRAKEQLEQRVEERTQELRMEIVERQRVQEQLSHQVMHDPLTGLPNRGLLSVRLNRVLSRMRRKPDRCSALMYLDIDRFKAINDRFGHLAGDAFLKEMAHRMQQCVRDPDIVARLSGDEFAIVLEDIETQDAAVRVAARILHALREPWQVADAMLEPTASIGIAMGDHRYPDSDALLHAADTALYLAKVRGRNGFVVFDHTLVQEAS